MKFTVFLVLISISASTVLQNQTNTFPTTIQGENIYSQNHKSDGFIIFVSIVLPILMTWILIDIAYCFWIFFTAECSEQSKFFAGRRSRHNNGLDEQINFSTNTGCGNIEKFSYLECSQEQSKLSYDPSYIINQIYLLDGPIHHHLQILPCVVCRQSRTYLISKFGTFKCSTFFKEGCGKFRILMIILLPISTFSRCLFKFLDWTNYFCSKCGNVKLTFDPHPQRNNH